MEEKKSEWPSVDNMRRYELVKELIINKGYNVGEAFVIADAVVERLKDK